MAAPYGLRGPGLGTGPRGAPGSGPAPFIQVPRLDTHVHVRVEPLETGLVAPQVGILEHRQEGHVLVDEALDFIVDLLALLRHEHAPALLEQLVHPFVLVLPRVLTRATLGTDAR